MGSDKGILYLARLSLVMITAVWGGGFVVVKNSLDELSPDFITTFRFTAAALIFAVVFHRHFKNLKKSTLIKGSLVGLTCWLGMYLQTIGQQYTDASKSSFLTAVYCVLTPFACWILTKKRPELYNFAAGIICLVGVGLVSLNGSLSAVNRGDMLTLCCGVAFAFEIALLGMCENEDMGMITFLQMAVSAVLSIVFYIGRGADMTLTGEAVSLSSWGSLLYLTVLSTTICLGIQNWAQKHVPASEASLLMCLEAVFGVIFAIIFCGDEMTVKLVAGFVLIFAAVLISEMDFKAFAEKRRLKAETAEETEAET